MVAQWLLSVLFVLGVAGYQLQLPLNNEPIIGVLSLPSGPQTPERFSYIAASYVKWLEGGGARVVPIPYDVSHDRLKTLFYSVNAIVFTGGQSVEDPTYYSAGELIYNMTVEATAQGDHMPLWGTCLGFEFLAMLASGDKNVLDDIMYDSFNLSLPLEFTSEAPSSRMYGPLVNTPLWDILQNKAVTPNEHEKGISPDRFRAAGLEKMFSMTSVNVDRKGVSFVSSFESWHHPIYGVQWHPEKIQYEWERHHNTAHTREAVLVGQYTAEFIVHEARHSMHKFASEEEEDAALMYNYSPVNTFNITKGHFAQIYFFPKQTAV